MNKKIQHFIYLSIFLLTSCGLFDSEDCDGVSGGIAYIDSCGGCVEGSTGLDECVDSDGDGYDDREIEVLQLLINTTIQTIDSTMDTNNNGLIDPLEYCQQEWVGGRLTVLMCQERNLSGEIPNQISELKKLGILWFYGNELTGVLPPSLGDLVNLRELTVMENNLTGEIPPELGNLKNLRLLRLDDNLFTGEFPEELGELTNLSTFFISNNLLSGELPQSLCNLYETDIHLYLGNNQFCPPIPDCIPDEDLGSQDCNNYPDCFDGYVGIDGYCT